MEPKDFSDIVKMTGMLASGTDAAKLADLLSWSTSAKPGHIGVFGTGNSENPAFTYDFPAHPPKLPYDTMKFFFESKATSEDADQLREERENVLAGLKAIEQSILYYSDKAQELHNKLNTLDGAIEKLKPGTFEERVITLETTSDYFVGKLEHEIVNALQKGGDFSDKTIIVHPNTWEKIVRMVGFACTTTDSRKQFYKGIPVVRSFDMYETEIIVK